MSDILTITPAVVSDIPQIKKLADTTFRASFSGIISSGQIDYMLEKMYSEKALLDQVTLPGGAFFVASVSGRKVGFVTAERNGHAEDGVVLFHLQKVYLLPSEQGKGYGKALFNHLVSYLKTICPGEKFRIELYVNRKNRAVGFYESLGMHCWKEVDIPIGEGYYMNDYIYIMDVDNR